MIATGQPHDAEGRVAEHAGGDARFLDRAVAAAKRADPAKIDVARPDLLASADDAGVGGVVGDRVDDGSRTSCAWIAAERTRESESEKPVFKTESSSASSPSSVQIACSRASGLVLDAKSSRSAGTTVWSPRNTINFCASLRHQPLECDR